MATITQIQQEVTNLAVRVSAEIVAVRAEIVAGGGGGGGGGGVAAWSTITGKPTTFAPSAHTHVAADVTDFSTAADARIAAAGVGGAPSWASVTGKPTTFTPSVHAHIAADVTDFSAAADARIALAGAGNVTGAASSTDGELVLFNGVTGKAIKNSSVTPSANGLSLISAADYAAMRASLTLVVDTDVQAYSAKLAALASLTWAADKVPYFTSAGAAATVTADVYGRSLLASTSANQARATLDDKESLIVAFSDETTALTTGVAKVTFRAPYAMALDLPKASLTTAATAGGLTTFDINVNGTSILSTKLSIDQNERTSVTAATTAALTSSPFSLAADDEITVDIDATGTGAKGGKITLIGLRL